MSDPIGSNPFKDFDYRTHPDTIQIDIAGQTFDWFLGKRSFDLAKERGTEMDEIFDAAAKGLDGSLETFQRMVWVGMLPFYPDLEAEDIPVSVGDMPRLQPKIIAPLNELADELQAHAGEEEDAAGNE